MKTQTETKHEQLMEEISDAIYKVFPNFDNNIEKETWALLVLSVEEICSQLGKKTELATYHGITKAICLNCGKITTDILRLELLNDLDAICRDCGIHAVAWHTAEGVIVTTDDIREVIVKK